MKKFTFKKQALVLTLVAALGVAVYLNYYFSDHSIGTAGNSGGNLGEAIFVDDSKDTVSDEGEAVSVGAQVNYFEQARKNRETAREEAVDIIKDIAADLKSDSAAAEKVLAQTTVLTEAITKEAKIEDLVKAKGFADCVVYIANGSCSVVVKAENLTGAQTLQISEIVTAQSGISAQKINIMAINS